MGTIERIEGIPTKEERNCLGKAATRTQAKERALTLFPLKARANGAPPASPYLRSLAFT